MAKDELNTAIRSIGTWRWNDDLLWSKIKATDNKDECWTWGGSTGPHANLFGARKNNGNKPQMTQAARLIWMSVHNEDVEHLEIRHSCGNRYCCNPKHLFAMPNHMRYRRDGTNLNEPQPKPTVPKVAAAPVTKKLWWQL